jgi:mono/diheme cytochrome c family protein
MRTWKAVSAVGIVATVGYFAYVVQGGFSTRGQPSKGEILAARFIREISVPSNAKNQINPLGAGATPEVMEGAQAHWADHCATCHSNDGSGDTAMGQNLYPRAPDMRLAPTQNLSDGELYYIIRNGVRLTGMPAWGDPKLERDDESWQLVLFIRHLPKMTVEEAEGMKALNPKTDADRAEELAEQDFLNGKELPEQAVKQEHHH